MKKYRIHLVMAARPNMMKIAPLYHALLKTDFAEPLLVHTGQHYDDVMSGSFLRTFGLPDPHYHLNIGSGSHGEQTGKTIMAYEALCQKDRPDFTLVVGDVNATIACALAAKKMGIPVGHMEAGLRSFDSFMPEEINRLATDSIADWLWTPSPDATENLRRENKDPARMREVGNVMIDAFCMVQEAITKDQTHTQFHGEHEPYGVITFHRPINVDHKDTLMQMIDMVENVTTHLKMVFPMHPRTKKNMEHFDVYDRLRACSNLHVCDPLPYVPFMNLVSHATCVLTDSGGVQEETTYLGIPCLTLRSSTERPITVTHGTNTLVTLETVVPTLTHLLDTPQKEPPVIPLWDGKAAQRAVMHLKDILSKG